MEVGPNIFIVEKWFRIEPCETPKFRIQVNVGWPGKGQRKREWGEGKGASDGWRRRFPTSSCKPGWGQGGSKGQERWGVPLPLREQATAPPPPFPSPFLPHLLCPGSGPSLVPGAGAESRRSRKWPGGCAPGRGSARSCWGAAASPGSGRRDDQRAGYLRREHDPHR